MDAASGATRTPEAGPARLSGALRARIRENVYRCWQCVRCTSGCPLAEQFDLMPHQVMRAVQMEDASVLESRAIWLCATCYTCATRCPRDIDVTAVIDALRIEARARAVRPALPEIAVFNAIFMRLTGFFGRLPEALLIGLFNLARREPTRDLGLGWKLWRRDRLAVIPRRARAPRTVKPLADGETRIGYFPGCAAEGSGSDYDRTARAAAGALDIALVEPEGWTCCGSSPAHATDAAAATLMPMRTIATVERMGIQTLTSPCSSCFARLKAAEREAREHPARGALCAQDSGHVYKGGVRVQHLLDTFMERAGPEMIAARARRPLRGLKVACYYGCLITRPARVTGAEHPEYPVKMDALMQALGAEPVAWSGKTECCGASLAITRTEAALGMARRILENARGCGAELVATMCPMCHMNLDARQENLGMEPAMPVLHATQLMLLAFGLDERAALLDKAIVDPRPALRAKGLLPGP